MAAVDFRRRRITFNCNFLNLLSLLRELLFCATSASKYARSCSMGSPISICSSNAPQRIPIPSSTFPLPGWGPCSVSGVLAVRRRGFGVRRGRERALGMALGFRTFRVAFGFLATTRRTLSFGAALTFCEWLPVNKGRGLLTEWSGLKGEADLGSELCLECYRRLPHPRLPHHTAGKSTDETRRRSRHGKQTHRPSQWRPHRGQLSPQGHAPR